MIKFFFLFKYYNEPPKRLQEELRKEGLSDMQFFLLKQGESRLIEIKEADKKDDEEQAGEDESKTSDQEKEDKGFLEQLVDQFVGDESKPEDEQQAEE